TIEQHHGRINIGWIGNAADPGKYTFELQKSTDGNVFTSVSNFPAYAEPFTYRYDDELKEDARFYRIKVNCKEGNIYTTRTVAATGKEDITCYPTVATDHVNITLSNIQAEVDYTIINAQGQTVGAGTISQAKNTISVREYAPGKYFIFMHKDKGEVITKGFIRQ
ncbi:MAG TPA: T9SS type A sorting domain-containing protein, partial [Flavipsychrobacter sp.]|nr:T9SS type A sorting domain-containing protein [Flavipsychrobacter sp.]